MKDVYMKPLIELIREEPISFIDGITYFNKGNQINKDYFVYWTIKDNKAVFNSGNILLVDNDNIEDSFREAIKTKYNRKVPRSETFDNIIEDKIYCALRERDNSLYY